MSCVEAGREEGACDSEGGSAKEGRRGGRRDGAAGAASEGAFANEMSCVGSGRKLGGGGERWFGSGGEGEGAESEDVLYGGKEEGMDERISVGRAGLVCCGREGLGREAVMSSAKQADVC